MTSSDYPSGSWRLTHPDAARLPLPERIMLAGWCIKAGWTSFGEGGVAPSRCPPA